MPFCPYESPHLGSSLLKSKLETKGYYTNVLYFNLKFLKELGLDVYDQISGNNNTLHYIVGDLVFSEYLFNKKLDIESTIQYFLRTKKELVNMEKIIENFQNAINIVPSFLERCLENIMEFKPKLIGFSNSYYQTCASVSLAKKIKEESNIPIIFGGANCEGIMGFTMLQCFPYIDYICSGDADISFIEFVDSLLNKKKISHINGILSRKSSILEIHLTKPVMEMNNLPFPNFKDYFDSINDDIVNLNQIKIGFETSRGCWWGENNHCTFCGLNGFTMKYRSKSSDRVFKEIKYIVDKYEINSFHFTDNILDTTYFKKLFPKIMKEKMDLNMFYETKSNLSKRQLHLMKRSGVNAIQPGLESLSDSILKIMNKGTTTLHNIFLLKMCQEIDLNVYWNILTGFPYESISDYQKMLEIIPLISHLQPPQYVGQFQLSRYSPYFYEPKKYGIYNIRPLKMYPLIYPFDNDTLSRLVYFFDYDVDVSADLHSEHKKLDKLVHKWRLLWSQKPPELKMKHSEKIILIKDTRPISTQNLYLLKNENLLIYHICESPQSFDNIYEYVQRNFPLNRCELESKLSILCDKKLLLEIDDQYLSLAIKI
ncbi:MAG: RiPP maturation radical SAM C-methyltransferase [Nitrososphaeraceae archaeon]